jgi:enolase
MSAIVDIVGREVLDSRGNPTVECDVLLESGTMGRAAVPSLAPPPAAAKPSNCATATKAATWARVCCARSSTSTPKFPKPCWAWMPPSKAFLDKTLIDLDGTDNKSRLGANAMLAVSMAVARAAAEESGLPLYRYFGGMGGMQMPVPMMNVINGGAARQQQPGPARVHDHPGGRTVFREACATVLKCSTRLKKILHDKGISTAVGDEGGFAPKVEGGHEAAIQLILQAIDKAGFVAGEHIALGLDCAASEFYKDGKYHLEGEGG